jgi:hypothetical protein
MFDSPLDPYGLFAPASSADESSAAHTRLVAEAHRDPARTRGRLKRDMQILTAASAAVPLMLWLLIDTPTGTDQLLGMLCGYILMGYGMLAMAISLLRCRSLQPADAVERERAAAAVLQLNGRLMLSAALTMLGMLVATLSPILLPLLDQLQR